jgi:hypothetical protein
MLKGAIHALALFSALLLVPGVSANERLAYQNWIVDTDPETTEAYTARLQFFMGSFLRWNHLCVLSQPQPQLPAQL